MKLFRIKFMWAIFYTVVLTAFTLYVVLDTFVITRVYTVVPETRSSPSSSGTTSGEVSQSAASTDEVSENQSSSTQSVGSESNVTNENTYSDENISITITEYRAYDTTIYVADIEVSSAEYLKTAFAQNAYGRNVTASTSDIAEDNNAVLAINGDYYGSQTKGYVLKNGSLYRKTSAGNQDLVIWEDGSFTIVEEDETSASTLLADGATQILSFGPALVTDGSVSVTQSEEVGKAMASNPRTAIGIVDDLHYLFVVSDGRTDESTGLSLYQLASFIQTLGAGIAYNLDGGGSSTMYFNGKVINNPTTNGNTIKERSVSDIVYIGY